MLALKLLLFGPDGMEAPAHEPLLLTRDFAGLTEADALALSGRRHRFRVVQDGDLDEVGGRVSFDRAGADDLHRAVRFMKGAKVDEGAEGFLVEARVRVIRHGGWGVFHGFVEVRLADAVPADRRHGGCSTHGLAPPSRGMPCRSRPPKRGLPNLSRPDPRTAGGQWFVRLCNPDGGASMLRPYENPESARDDAEKVRWLVADVIREARQG